MVFDEMEESYENGFESGYAEAKDKIIKLIDKAIRSKIYVNEQEALEELKKSVENIDVFEVDDE